MKYFYLRNLFRSLVYYRKDAVYQIVIVALLTAVISGSLLTGESVRESLRKTSAEKLGNTDILVSSGLRYFDFSLASSLAMATGDETAAILEMDGYCQNFATGKTVLNTKILGVDEDFFIFNTGSPLGIEPGHAALNSRLASMLEVVPGDEIIVRFSSVDPIPANAPFAPNDDRQNSRVLKVSMILESTQSADFSLTLSQITPLNIFLNIGDINQGSEDIKANRILMSQTDIRADEFYTNTLKDITKLSDIGLSIRRSSATGVPELISERIFIDSTVTHTILSRVPGSYPVLTYLANSVSFNGESTPYSFVSAFDSDLSLNEGVNGNEIIISRWMADDLGAKKGDEITLSWFVQGFAGRLKEENTHFIVSAIAENGNKILDPSLMPDFPGISGRTTCSAWDAGIPVLLERIRQKDEDYWNAYGGTPKAFVNYETGRKLWANNFGTATAIRFPSEMTKEEILDLTAGSIDPVTAGITVRDIRKASVNAAEGGTDFGTLFIALGFFLIVSCLILLALAVSVFFDSRKGQVRTLFALGFRNRNIRNMLFAESIVISVSGALPGAFAGYLINVLVINALNGVWAGAVQTNTLLASFTIWPLLQGFLAALIISSLLIFYRTRRFIALLSKPKTGELKMHSVRRNNVILTISSIMFGWCLFFAIKYDSHSTILAFVAGVLFFIAMILVIRSFYITAKGKMHPSFSGKYYFFNPEQAITPVVIIAAGIFAVMVTAANRQIPDERLLPSGGTGGYLLWAESALPVKQNINSGGGRQEFGLDEQGFEQLSFVQAARVSGDDASCLNLNLVESPPILGIDPGQFIKKGSFSFASGIKEYKGHELWNMLGINAGSRTIYGFADETVLQWGLKLSAGDTIEVMAEDGSPLNIIIGAGLRSSVFQGHLLIHENDLNRYFPSVAGSSVFLADGDPDKAEFYIEALSERFSAYGMQVMKSTDKLASFLEVTNTYLDVFMIMGVLGMVLGAAGLGFVLLRNFNSRRKEFAIMAATGFSQKYIRMYIVKDQAFIVFWGILTGTVSGLIATLTSLGSGTAVPWTTIIIMTILIAATATAALFLSVRKIRTESLIVHLRNE